MNVLAYVHRLRLFSSVPRNIKAPRNIPCFPVVSPHGLCVLILSHTYACVIDHVEPELEEPIEQAQVEDPANLAWIKASSGAFNQFSISFILNLCFMFYLIDCALSQ
jgi:hypothetical protein